MKKYYHLFPFDKVPYGSSLIIYGMGEVGQWYVQQLQRTGYAKIVAITDKQWDKYSDMGEVVISPESIQNYNYDYVLIAIENTSIALEVKKTLEMKLDIGIDKIILGDESLCIVPRFMKKSDMPRLAIDIRGIPVALYLSGGIGDCIIYKRKIEEILQWDNRIVIDCYMPESMLMPMHSFFDGEYNGRINAFIGGPREKYNKNMTRYTITMALSTDMDVDYIKEEELLSAPNLLMMCLKLQKQCKAYGKSTGEHRALHYARCEKDGLDCYKSYNRYVGFNVQDFHTNIPMNKAWKSKYEALDLNDKYITVNYGFDGSAKNPANKCWPKERFESFIKLFKARYPNIKIIQIGAAEFPNLAGCDRAFLGESLELVKYILLGAMFHFDIEGGLVHLASQLDTKCVVLFGPTPLHYYAYENNINIQSGPCHDCCWYTEKFQECYRHMSEPECMYSITPELVMEKVEENFAASFRG